MSDGAILLVNSAYDELDEFVNYVKWVRSARSLSTVNPWYVLCCSVSDVDWPGTQIWYGLVNNV